MYEGIDFTEDFEFMFYLDKIIYIKRKNFLEVIERNPYFISLCYNVKEDYIYGDGEYTFKSLQ